MGKKIDGISLPAQEALAHYGWPGNIRELQNCMERAAIVARAPVIEPKDLMLFGPEAPGASAQRALPSDLDGELERIEREFLLEPSRKAARASARGRAARHTERSLWHRVKKLAIKVSRVAEPHE